MRDRASPPARSAVALGLGGESMINITAYVGWIDGNGQGQVQSYYITGGPESKPFVGTDARSPDHHAKNVYATGEVLSDASVERDAGARAQRASLSRPS